MRRRSNAGVITKRNARAPSPGQSGPDGLIERILGDPARSGEGDFPPPVRDVQGGHLRHLVPIRDPEYVPVVHFVQEYGEGVSFLFYNSGDRT